MAYFVEVYCRLAIRLCVGYHANGREKYRTVNILNVRRGVTAEQVALFVRALEPLLDGRVLRVRVIRKDRLVMDGVTRGGTPPARYAAGTPLASEGGKAGDSGGVGAPKGPLACEGAVGRRLTGGALPRAVFFATSRRTQPATQIARGSRRLRAPPAHAAPLFSAYLQNGGGRVK